VRKQTRNVRAPAVLSLVAPSDARSSNSLSQPDRFSSQEKLILLASRIRTHAGPASTSDPCSPQQWRALARRWATTSPSVRTAILYHMREPGVIAIRANPSSPVDRNLKRRLGQGRNPGSCLILRGSPGHDRVERKLAATLAADVAGYSRLTGQGEEGTHARLLSHLRSLVDRRIAEHRGRVTKNTWTTGRVQQCSGCGAPCC
jgi:hypothetical protein